MPDAKTMGRWGAAVRPQALKQIHERIVKIAAEKGVTEERRMRVDTTVVEANIHHPTDSTLLGDGVRVLTRTIKKITKIVDAVGTQLCEPQPRRQVPAVGDRSRVVAQAAFLGGDRPRRQAGDDCHEAAGAGGAASRT